MELLKYKHNIIRPQIALGVWNRSTTGDRNEMELDLKLGVYHKWIAKLIRLILKRRGYQVKLRGRGERASKYQNSNGDIRIKDSLFLSVYAYKKVNCFNIKF